MRLQEHQKAVTCGEVEKSGVADHIWKEKGDHRPLWDQVEIIDKEHHWKIRKLKETAHMLGHKNLTGLRGIKMDSDRSSRTNKTGASRKINVGYDYFRATVGIFTRDAIRS